MKCLQPHCQRIGHCRGLCASCYTLMTRAARKGTFTLAEMEAQGLILPAKARDNGARGCFRKKL